MVTETTTINENIALNETLSTSTLSSFAEGLTLNESFSGFLKKPSLLINKPVFTFTINNVQIGIIDFSLRKSSSGETDLTVTTYDTVTEDNILKEVELQITDIVNNITKTIFKGVCVSIITNLPDKKTKITCKGVEYYLQNDLFITDVNGTITGVFEFTKERADNVAKAILDGTGFTLVECPTDYISVKFDYENRWKALQLIADITNKNVWVDVNKGVHIGNISGYAEIADVKEKELSKTGDETYNKIIVVGSNDGFGNVPIAIAEDTGLISQQGVKAKKISIPQIRDKDTALLLAKAYLDVYKNVNYVLTLKLPAKFEYYLLNPNNVVKVDAVEYIISSISCSKDDITIEASPYKQLLSLTKYLERQRDIANATLSKSTFYNESPTYLTAYEHLDLDILYYGGSTAKTITANDNNTYTILSVMHFYVPSEFTIKDGELRIRWYGEGPPPAFKVVVNGDVYDLTNEGTTADGDIIYYVSINASSLKNGWNNIYFVQ